MSEPTVDTCMDAMQPTLESFARTALSVPLNEEDRCRLACQIVGFFLGVAAQAAKVADPALRSAPMQEVAKKLLEGMVEGMSGGPAPKGKLN